jgi:phosphatidylinositol 4-kinase
LIWNMQTNMYKDEDQQEPDREFTDISSLILSSLLTSCVNTNALLADLYDHLEHLIKTIVDSLSGPAKEFYEREFDFFGKITAISGEIRNYPKGKERKEALLKALRKIQVQLGCYLPSNAEALVLDIDPEKGIPLQSAAKAPFLARFKVALIGSDQLERLAMSSDSHNTHNNRMSLGVELWQAAIFKVGDDVRQVSHHWMSPLRGQ